MKKWIALFLSSVLTLGLVGCGGEQTEPQAQSTTVSTDTPTEATTTAATDIPETTEPDAETEPTEEPAAVCTMSFQTMDAPTIGALEWSQTGAYPLATTDLNCNPDALYDWLKTEPAFQGYELTRTWSEEYQYSDFSDGRFLNVTDTIMLSSEDKGIINFCFRQDANTYRNYDTVSVNAFGVELTAEFQDTLHRGFAVLGLGLMDYLLLAQDSDGKLAAGDDFYEWYTPECLDEYAETSDGVKYLLEREIRQGYTDLELGVRVFYNPTINGNYEDGAYPSLYRSAPYGFADVAGEGFGSTDPMDSTGFASGALKGFFPDYISTSIPKMKLEKILTSDGLVQYHFTADLCYQNAEGSRTPTLYYGLSYTMDGDTLTDAKAGVHMVGIETADPKPEFERALVLMEAMIPGSKTENLNWEASDVALRGRMVWSDEGTTSLLGTQSDLDITLMYTEQLQDFSISVNMDLLTYLGCLA